MLREIKKKKEKEGGWAKKLLKSTSVWPQRSLMSLCGQREVWKQEKRARPKGAFSHTFILSVKTVFTHLIYSRCSRRSVRLNEKRKYILFLKILSTAVIFSRSWDLVYTYVGKYVNIKMLLILQIWLKRQKKEISVRYFKIILSRCIRRKTKRWRYNL